MGTAYTVEGTLDSLADGHLAGDKVKAFDLRERHTKPVEPDASYLRVY